MSQTDKPQVQLTGHDGNIFSILGRTSKALKRAGMEEQSEEMCKRVYAAGNFNQALSIITEYVDAS